MFGKESFVGEVGRNIEQFIPTLPVNCSEDVIGGDHELFKESDVA